MPFKGGTELSTLLWGVSDIWHRMKIMKTIFYGLSYNVHLCPSIDIGDEQS